MIRNILIGPSPRLSVDVIGAGEPVFFLHGLGGNRTNWHGNMLSLAPSFQTMAWDARGYGGSDDHDGPLDFDHFADDLLRAFDHFELPKVHLVGLSMGASIAAYFHSKHPARLRTLTLCDTDMGFNRYTEEERQEYCRLRREPLQRGVRPEEIADDVARALIGDARNRAVFERLRDSMRQVRAGSYIKAFDALAAREDDTALYANIEIPLLLIVGALDKVTPPALVREIKDHCPHALYREIERAGHLPNIETPETFDALLFDFLRSGRDEIHKSKTFKKMSAR